MSHLKYFFSSSCIAILMLRFSSCVSSETVEPESPLAPSSEPGDEIVLNLSAPSNMKTRSHDGHRLRYVAKLFQLQNGTEHVKNSLVRQEILEGDAENKIVFKVTQKLNYGIYVFADYIPEDKVSLGSEGYYKDYYYDTSSEDATIKLNTTPGISEINEISSDFFNNDNYDCFSYFSDKIYKESGRVELKAELKRAVAKIQIKDNSKNPGTIDKINIEVLNLYTSFNQKSQAPLGSSKKFSKVLMANEIKSFEGDEDGKVLFSFYTPAFEKRASNNNTLYLKFTTLINNDVEIKEKSISKTLEVAKNYITTLIGTIIPQNFNNSPGEQDPSEDNSDEIELTLSTNQDWLKPDIEQNPD